MNLCETLATCYIEMHGGAPMTSFFAIFRLGGALVLVSFELKAGVLRIRTELGCATTQLRGVVLAINSACKQL